MIKVGILIDNIIRQKNLELILSSCGDIKIIGTHLGLFKTLRENPDIIIMEVLSETDETHVLNLLSQIRSSTNCKIIVVSDAQRKFLFRLTNYIVNEIVIYDPSGNISRQNIIQAIYNVSQNRNLIDRSITETMMTSKIIDARNYDKIDEHEQNRAIIKCCEYRLTEKERQILYLIASGKKNQEIASNLKVKLPTIKTHINNIQKKMGTNTRIYTVIQALLDGVINIEEIKADSKWEQFLG